MTELSEEHRGSKVNWESDRLSTNTWPEDNRGFSSSQRVLEESYLTDLCRISRAPARADNCPEQRYPSESG